MNLDKEDLSGIDVSEIEKDVMNASVLHTDFNWMNLIKDMALDYNLPLRSNIIDRNESKKFVCENVISNLDFEKNYSFQEIFNMFVKLL